MAITIIAQPQDLTPAYNPMYFYVDSTSKTQLGFRYIIEVTNVNTSEVIGTYKLKPIPTTLYGEVDISKLIQSELKTDFKQMTHNIASNHLVSYRLQIDEEYFVSLAFLGYGFAGAINWPNYSSPSINPNGFSRTFIASTTLPTYLPGDVVLINQTSVAFRPELEGVHTVLDVFLSGGFYFIVLDLLWIGSGINSTGNVSYADGQKTIVSGIMSGIYSGFKGAFKFLDFKNYDHLNYITDGVTKKLLTTIPNGVRISRNKPTNFSFYNDDAAAIWTVFNVAGVLYRFSNTIVNEQIGMFDALPSGGNIDQVFTGGSWVPYVSGLDLSTVESYTIQLKTTSNVVRSEIKTIVLYSECDYFTTYDICFQDRLGSWITVPFYKGSYINQDVQRENVRTKYGNYSDGEWVYNASDKGQRTYHVEETISYNVNTDILSEIECQYYRELLSSPQAYVSIDGGEFQAITITTASMPLHLKRTQRNRKVTLNFIMAVQDEING